MNQIQTYHSNTAIEVGNDSAIKGFQMLKSKSQKLRSAKTKHDKVSLREGKKGQTFNGEKADTTFKEIDIYEEYEVN